ncbi:MAG: 4-hydroxy-tetrahydrodipicolinate synthase, partial [Lachnospiraceae bacterium]|nr:4-hydroxy-tetrahydrodipicolinate synthase [Lachnospiraceae bacterium]
TTGESATLSEAEHEDVVRFAIRAVDHRVPIIAGTGSNATDTAIMLSKAAEADGADALLLVTPYYNKATQNGLFAHYKAISDEVNIPMIVYNVPSRTGTNVLPATMARMAKEIEHVVAIKEASGNISQIAQLAALVGDTCDIYSGNDDQIIPIMALGGKGVISVLSNIAPQQTHDICQAYFDGDTAKAAKFQLDAIDLIGSLFCEVNPIPVKTAMNMMGMEVGPLRMPLTPMEEKNAERLRASMSAYGLL